LIKAKFVLPDEKVKFPKNFFGTLSAIVVILKQKGNPLDCFKTLFFAREGSSFIVFFEEFNFIVSFL